MVVAAVPVAEVKLSVVMLPRVLKRSVEVAAVVVESVKSAPAEFSAVMFARVLNRSVEVAAVVVARPIERNWYVDDALTMVLVAEREPTFCRLKELAKMFDVQGVWLPVLSVPQTSTPAALVSMESHPMSEAIAKLVVVADVPVALPKLSVLKLARVLKRSEEVALVVIPFVMSALPAVKVVAKRLVEDEFVTMAFKPVSVPGTYRAVLVAPVNTPLVP